MRTIRESEASHGVDPRGRCALLKVHGDQPRGSLRRCRFFAICILAALFAPAVAFAQPRQAPQPAQKPVEIPAGGTELFRALLDRAGVKPIKYQEWWNLQRFDDVMVIWLGNPNGWNVQFNNANDPTRRAIQGGGAALIAIDTQTHIASRQIRDPRLNWRTVGVSVGSGWVQSKDDNSILGGREYCPFVVPLTPETHPEAPDAFSPAAQVFKGLTKIATNQPAPLRVSGFGGEFSYALARYPRGSYLADRGGDHWDQMPADALFAVGGVGPDDNLRLPYRFLVMGDHSVFINQMLIEPGTQNLELTYRVMEFLGDGRRKRCLFVENGQVIEKFDGLRQAFAKQKPPLPTPNLGAMQEKLVDMGNAIADKAQSENWLNKFFFSAFSLPGMVRFLMLAATIYAVWFLLRRMFSSRKPTDIPQPPAVAGVPAGPPGVFDRRQKELVRRNNVYEPVRDMVREFFVSIGIHGDQGPKLPRLVISNVVRKPDSLRLAVKDFWKLAYGPPQEVTVSRWRELEPYFERLRQAHADGKWHFELQPVVAMA